MRKLLSALAVLLALGIGTARAADEPALPDYSKEPFTQFSVQTQTVQGHEDWGTCTVTLYTTSKERKAGAQAVYVVTDKDGNKKLADWLAVNDTATGWAFMRRYLYADAAWKFEKNLR